MAADKKPNRRRDLKGRSFSCAVRHRQELSSRVMRDQADAREREREICFY